MTTSMLLQTSIQRMTQEEIEDLTPEEFSLYLSEGVHEPFSVLPMPLKANNITWI